MGGGNVSFSREGTGDIQKCLLDDGIQACFIREKFGRGLVLAFTFRKRSVRGFFSGEENNGSNKLTPQGNFHEPSKRNQNSSKPWREIKERGITTSTRTKKTNCRQEELRKEHERSRGSLWRNGLNKKKKKKKAHKSRYETKKTEEGDSHPDWGHGD